MRSFDLTGRRIINKNCGRFRGIRPIHGWAPVGESCTAPADNTAPRHGITTPHNPFLHCPKATGRPPSRRMVSPLNITFSTICRARAAYSSGRPRRLGRVQRRSTLVSRLCRPATMGDRTPGAWHNANTVGGELASNQQGYPRHPGFQRQAGWPTGLQGGAARVDDNTTPPSHGRSWRRLQT